MGELSTKKVYNVLYPVYKLIMYYSGDQSDPFYRNMIDRKRVTRADSCGYVSLVMNRMDKLNTYGNLKDLYVFSMIDEESEEFNPSRPVKKDLLYIAVRDYKQHTGDSMDFFEYGNIHLIVLPEYIIQNESMDITSRWMTSLVGAALSYGQTGSFGDKDSFEGNAIDALVLFMTDLLFIHNIYELELGELSKYVEPIISTGYVKVFNAIETILDEADLLEQTTLDRAINMYLKNFVNSQSLLWNKFMDNEIVSKILELDSI